MTVVIMAAVLLSLSRGGILSLIAGVASFFIFLGFRLGFGRSFKAAGVVLLALVVVVWLGADPVINRLTTLMDVPRYAGVRIDANRAMVAMLGDFTWTGTGPGTFGAVHPGYDTSGKFGHIDHGHNDYL